MRSALTTQKVYVSAAGTVLRINHFDSCYMAASRRGGKRLRFATMKSGPIIQPQAGEPTRAKSWRSPPQLRAHATDRPR
jgi:hypothetical protein